MCNTGLNIIDSVPTIAVVPKDLDTMVLDTVALDTIPPATLPHIKIDLPHSDDGTMKEFEWTSGHIKRAISIMVLFFLITFLFVLAATFFAQACLNQF